MPEGGLDGYLRERLSGIAQCAPGSRRDPQNDVEYTLLNGRKKAISLDKLAKSGAPWYGSVDTSPDEVLYRTQYGEWILVSEPIDWGTGKCSIEARELTPAQAHAWFWENQIDLPDSLKGIDLHDMDPSEKKGSDLTSTEKAVPKWTPAMDRLTLVKTLTGLDPSDLTTVITLISGAVDHVSRQGTVREQAARVDPLGRELDWTGAGGDRGGSQGAPKPLTGLPPLTGTPAAGQREGLSPAHRPCNLPFTTLGTLFKGRQEFLADLRRNLVREDRRAVAVHGLGGVGKTRAALEYAWRHDKDYTALLLVSAPTAAELRANLANLAGVLAIESTVTAVDQQVAEVLRWLEAHPGWLLIVDNVDTEDAASEVERLLAKLRAGHVLITSRIAEWSAGVEPLELHVLAAADATAFLLERTPHRRRAADDPSVAAAAARELGCLALALEQAGAYIDRLRLSFAEYLGRWRQKRPEVLRWHDERLMQYPASVAITWETTFAQLREPEQRLLQVLAWLAPEPIPVFLFDAQPLSQAIPEPREALAGLAAFSLARFEAAGDAVAVHRLVQEVARSRAAEPDRQTALRTALDTLNAAAVGSPQDVRSWPIWTPLAPTWPRPRAMPMLRAPRVRRRG